MKINKIVLTALLILSPLAADSNETAVSKYNEQYQGAGVVYRSGTIPYMTEDSVVSTLVPMLFFEIDSGLAYLNDF